MSKKIMLHNVRLSYEHIFTPSSFDDNQAPKYSATLIVPKDHSDIRALKQTLFEVGAEDYPQAFSSVTAWPSGFTCALKDGDVDVNQEGVTLSEKNPEYAGCYVLKADSISRPLVVDRKKAAITEADGKIYSGCYVNVSIGIATYEFSKGKSVIKKGVKAYLNGVQFVSDGERFGSDYLSDFDELDGAGDDDSWM